MPKRPGSGRSPSRKPGVCGRVAGVQASTSAGVERSTSPLVRRGAPSHPPHSWEELTLKLANLIHLSEPVSGQEAGPPGQSAPPRHAALRVQGLRGQGGTWGGGLPPGSPRPSSWLVPFAPRHPKASAPRRPTGADARAADLSRSASFCHLKPLAPAGSLTLSLNPRSLSELSRQGLARPSASNPRRARRPPGTPPGPGDPAPHATTSRPRHRHPNFLHVVCAPRLGVRLPC